MKRILLISIILAAMLLSACVAPVTTPEPTLTPTPARATPKPPQIFEMTIKFVPYFGWLDPQSNRQERERGTFRFAVEAGNRVEGELALTKYLFSKPGVPVSTDIEPVFANVRDPYENVFLQSARTKTPGEVARSSQKFPWRFSFVASTTGEFSLPVVTSAFPQASAYDAHLKVTVYEK